MAGNPWEGVPEWSLYAGCALAAVGALAVVAAVLLYGERSPVRSREEAA